MPMDFFWEMNMPIVKFLLCKSSCSIVFTLTICPPPPFFFFLFQSSYCIVSGARQYVKLQLWGVFPSSETVLLKIRVNVITDFSETDVFSSPKYTRFAAMIFSVSSDISPAYVTESETGGKGDFL